MTAQILPNKRTPDKQKPLYSISEAAKFLRVSPKTLRRWEKRGLITSFRTNGNQRRYSLEELNRVKEPARHRKLKALRARGRSIPETPEKGFLSIGEAAEQLGVSTKTLRRWDKQGILSPIRTAGGQRRYTQESLDHIKERPAPPPRVGPSKVDLRRKPTSAKATAGGPPRVRVWTLEEIRTPFRPRYTFRKLAVIALAVVVAAQLWFALPPLTKKRLERTFALSPINPIVDVNDIFEYKIGKAGNTRIWAKYLLETDNLVAKTFNLIESGVFNTTRLLGTVFFGKGERYFITPLADAYLRNLDVGSGKFTVSGETGATAIKTPMISGTALDISFESPVQTGDLTGIGVDFGKIIDPLPTDTRYGVHLKDSPEPTATDYGVYVEGTDWDYGIYSEDDIATTESLRVGRNTEIGGTLTVGDETTITGNLLPGIDSTFDIGATNNEWANLYVDNVTADTIVSGDTTLSSLTVTGQTDLQGDVLDTTGNLTLNDTVDISEALNVTGAGTFSSTLGVTGDTTISADLNVGGDLSVTGSVSGGAADFSSLIVTGTSDLRGDVLDTTGNLTLNDTVDISGDLTVSGGDIDGPLSSITMADGGWVGIGSAAERIIFDDTGDAIEFLGANVGIGALDPYFTLDVLGDIRIRSANKLYFGGVGAADNDVNLYRSAADTLKTDDLFIAAGVNPTLADTDSLGSTSAEWQNLYLGDVGKIYFGLAQDTSMYRSGAGVLRLPTDIEQIADVSVTYLHSTYSNEEYGSEWYFLKARGTEATPAVVQISDRLGSLGFYGYSTAAGPHSEAARIGVLVDAEPSTGGDTTDMPGRISFYTTPDGSSTTLERLRIDNAGKVWFNPSAALDTNLYRSAADTLKTDDGLIAASLTVSQDGDVVPATTTGTSDLGSSSIPWDNVYADNYYQGSTAMGIWFDGGTYIYPSNVDTSYQIANTTGDTTIPGNLAVNGGEITSTAATLTINAGGTVDIQDNLTADQLTTDVGGVSIAAGQSYTGSGAVTLSSGGANTLTIDTGVAAALNIGTTTQNALTLGRAGANIILGAQANAADEAVRADRTLTFNSDTNVTITSGVQDLTANRTWNLGWTGQLAVGRGGTGAGTFTKGVLLSPGGTTAFTTVAGTDNYIPKWSSSYLTTTSLIYDDGTGVGIGTTSPDGLQINAAVTESADGTDNIRLGVAGGTPRIILEDSGSTQWEIDNSGGELRFLNPGVVQMWLSTGGDLYIGSTGNTKIYARSSTAGAQPAFTLQNTGNTSAPYFEFQLIPSSTDKESYVRYNYVGATQVTDILVVKGTGNVGIGTAGPDFALDVSGDVRIEGANKLYFGGTGAADNDTNLYRSAADTLKTDDSLVIEGDPTAASSKALEINNAGAVTGTGYGAYITKTGASTTNVGLFVTASGATNNYAAIFDAGNVGIGTTSPDFDLHIRGISVDRTSVTDLLALGAASTGGAPYSGHGQGIVFYDRTYASATQKVLSRIYSKANDASASTAGTDLVFQTITDTGDASPGTKMIIRYNGNVGIGTTSPDAKLDVGSGAVKTGSGYAVGTRQGNNYRVEGGTYNCTFSGVQYCSNVGVTFSVAFSSTPKTNCTENDPNSTQRSNTICNIWNTSTTGFSSRLNDIDTARSYTATVGWLAYGTTTMTDFDLAESYKTKDQSVNSGDVVCIDPENNSHIVKCQNPYDPTAIGIVSTEPGLIIGEEPGPNSRLVGLQGRVPVKVTLENGPIERGDPLAPSATKPGYAMKATKPGQIVGKALQPFNGKSTVLGENAFDGLSEDRIKEIMRKTEETGEGQTMAFINVSWYDPDVFLTDTGGLQISTQIEQIGTNGTDPLVQAESLIDAEDELLSTINYQLSTISGEAVTRVGAFSEVATAYLKTGKIDTQELTIDGQSLEEYLKTLMSAEEEILVDAEGDLAKETGAGSHESPEPDGSGQAGVGTEKILAEEIEAEKGIFQRLTAKIGEFVSIIANSIKTAVLEVTDTLTAKLIKTERLEAGEGEFGTLKIKAEEGTIGEAVIPAGETKILITNNSITNYSKIFFTPLDPTSGQQLFISKKEKGQFEVSIDTPLNYDLRFDYWVVN